MALLLNYDAIIVLHRLGEKILERIFNSVIITSSLCLRLECSLRELSGYRCNEMLATLSGLRCHTRPEVFVHFVYVRHNDYYAGILTWLHKNCRSDIIDAAINDTVFRLHRTVECAKLTITLLLTVIGNLRNFARRARKGILWEV